MKTKSERREEKRRKQKKGKLMRGNRWIFLRRFLSVKRYHAATQAKKEKR